MTTQNTFATQQPSTCGYEDILSSTLLTPEETAMLFQRIELGDTDARQTVICRNLQLAFSVALQSAQKHNLLCEIEDLKQEAVIGLIRAVDTFNYRLRYRFPVYAVPRISRYVSNVISRIPHYIFIDDIPLEAYTMPLKNLKLSTQEDDPELAPQEHHREIVFSALSSPILTSNERHIIQRFYGIGCEQSPLHEVAKEVPCSLTKAKAMHCSALEKIRCIISDF